jgi:hypothetical protein
MKSLPPVPYKPNCPASAEIFVGRTELLQMATTGLRIGGICYSIIGKPGMGKTSLLNAISRSLLLYAQEAMSGAIPVPIYVDCQQSHQALNHLLEEILAKTVEALGIQQKLDCPIPLSEKVQAAATKGQNLNAILSPLMDWGFKQKNFNYLPVLILDDLHRLCHTRLLGELTSLLQTAVNQQHIALVLAGRDALTDELRNDVSPLRLLITQNCELEPLTLPETESLVTKAENLGWPVETAFSQRIHHITQGHPYSLHYYLHRALTSQGELKVEGLKTLYTPENIKHLKLILNSQSSETDQRRNQTGLTQQEAEKIRAWVLENQLDIALQHLQEVQQHQLNADLLFLQLNLAAERERKGTLTLSDLDAERMRIAEQLLKLIQ